MCAGMLGHSQVCIGVHGCVRVCLGVLKNVFKSWFLVPKLRRYFVQITFEIILPVTTAWANCRKDSKFRPDFPLQSLQ